MWIETWAHNEVQCFVFVFSTCLLRHNAVIWVALYEIVRKPSRILNKAYLHWFDFDFFKNKTSFYYSEVLSWKPLAVKVEGEKAAGPDDGWIPSSPTLCLSTCVCTTLSLDQYLLSLQSGELFVTCVHTWTEGWRMRTDSRQIKPDTPIM